MVSMGGGRAAICHPTACDEPCGQRAALVASRVGEQFDPGHGRLMKGWLTVTSAKASWVELAKEAHDFVKGAKRA
jgi:hypothetical protein